MRSKSDHAWRMAAECAKLAQGADEKDEREFYVRMRDSWITVANRYEFLDVIDEQGRRPNGLAVLPGSTSRIPCAGAWSGDEDPLGARDGDIAAAKPWIPGISAFTRVHRPAYRALTPVFAGYGRA